MYRNKTLPGPAPPGAVASLPGAPGPGFILYEFELNLTVIR